MGCLTQLPEVSDPCGDWPSPGLYALDVEVDGRTRSPQVYVPASAGPRDIVVLLHGAGGNASGFSETTQFIEAADEEGFVFVAPNGLGFPLRAWNAGFGPDVNADDVAFLDATVAAVSERVCGDRTLATGFSNGGMMVHRWGCEGNQVDAIAAVAGPLLIEGCEGGSPLPVLHLHGTNDRVVPIGGGESSLGYEFPPVQDTIATWRERNECTEVTLDAVRDGDTVCTPYDCSVPTELCVIEEWAHRWPGGENSRGTDADATRRVWEWFRQIPQQAG